MILGQYRPLDSFLHRLDARSKMIPITLVLVLSLLTQSTMFYVVMLAALILSLLLSGISLAVVAGNYRAAFLLVVVTVAYHLLFSARDTELLVQFWLLRVTSGALHDAVFYSMRLLLFVSVAFLVTLTSSPSDLAEACVKLLRPLARLRVPLDDLAMIIFIAMRFIPILYEEFRAIRNAQIIRGVDFSGNLVRRIKISTVIIVPVFVAALQRADDLALAIEARGYRSSERRTMYTHARFGRAEVWFALASTAFIAGVFWWVR
jgi:energy-coupling factor transport system permease protein